MYSSESSSPEGGVVAAEEEDSRGASSHARKRIASASSSRQERTAPCERSAGRGSTTRSSSSRARLAASSICFAARGASARCSEKMACSRASGLAAPLEAELARRIVRLVRLARLDERLHVEQRARRPPPISGAGGTPGTPTEWPASDRSYKSSSRRRTQYLTPSYDLRSGPLRRSNVSSASCSALTASRDASTVTVSPTVAAPAAYLTISCVAWIRPCSHSPSG